MGGSSKKQTVGYKYHLGMDLRLCHGPIDSIRGISVDDRRAWSGINKGTPVTIDKPNLFGGEPREGGVGGTIDLDFGGPNQGQNSYLKAQLGDNVPAFRGVVGAVFRQCYLGNNPYLKPWSFLAQRIFTTGDGTAPQWYKERAAIGSTVTEDVAVYIALDYSGSMDSMMSNGKTRYENARAGIIKVIEALRDARELAVAASGDVNAAPRVWIGVSLWGNASTLYYEVNNNLPDSYNQLITFLNSQNNPSFSTNFSTAANNLTSFFSGVPSSVTKRVMAFLSDGEPTDDPQSLRDAIDAHEAIYSPLEVYGISLDITDTSSIEVVDDTNFDGVPVVKGDDSDTIYSTIMASVASTLDMNPAHILWEVLTNDEWGMGYPEADLNEDSFRAAADTLYSEGMGISLMWAQAESIEKFCQEIIKHIQGNLYVEPTTGLFTLTLVRADYDEETLETLGEGQIVEVSNLKRPQLGEVANQVTVKYSKGASTEYAAVTATDEALIQMQGAVIGTTLQFPGFTNGAVAARAAMRELKTLSSQLMSCDVVATRAAAHLRPGSVFKMDWPDEGISGLVMRVIKITLGDGQKNEIRMSVVEDAFAVPDAIFLGDPDREDVWTPPSNEPVPAERRHVFELPYYDLVQSQGQEAVDSALAANPDAGYLGVAAGKPSGGFNARYYADAGAGFEDEGVLDFCGSAVLDQAIAETATTLQIRGGSDLDVVEVGTLATIGGIENVVVLAIDEAAGTVQVGRGIHDTPPRKHGEGAVIVFWDNYLESNEIEYVAGESVGVKITPTTGGGELPLSDAPEDVVLMRSRAILPYPPGDLKVNGQSYPTATIENVPLSITWAHRDRLQQTGGSVVDHFAASVGPELGTVYRVRGYQNDVFLTEEDDIDGLSAIIQPDITSTVRIEVDAKRDGYYSYRPAMVEISYSMEVDEQAVSESILTKLRNWWPMDDSAGSTVLRDVHGGGDLTIVGGANLTLESAAVAPEVGTSSAYFGEGAAAKLYGMPTWMAYDENAKDAAFMAFFLPDAIDNTGGGPRYFLSNALSSDATSAINFQFQISMAEDGEFAFFWEYGGGVNVSQNTGEFPVALPSTTMLVANRDAAALSTEVIINGVPRGSATYSANPTGGGAKDSHLIIGNQQDLGEGFLGSMQGAALFREPLTLTESNWLYNSGAGRKYEDLLVLSGRGAKWSPANLDGKVVWLIGDDEHGEPTPGDVAVLHNRAGYGPSASANASGSNGYAQSSAAALNGRAVLTGNSAASKAFHLYQENTRERFSEVSGSAIAMLLRNGTQPDLVAGPLVFAAIPTTGTNSSQFLLATNWAVAGDVYTGARRLATDTFEYLGSGQSEGTGWAIWLAVLNYSTGELELRKNGSSLGKNTAITTGITAGGNRNHDIHFGGYPDTSNYRHGDWQLAEGLILNKALSLEEAERLEGYLAHSWGLAGDLPAEHPYKAAAPYLDGYAPAPSGEFQFSEAYIPSTSMQFEA